MFHIDQMLAYLATGAIAGFLAGLLGIGGGVLLVPCIATILAWGDFPREWIFHSALGTGMATILFTAVSSVRAHHQAGAVLWKIVLAFTPGILLGTAIGAGLARLFPAEGLALFFAFFMCLVAVQFWLDKKPAASRILPEWYWQSAVAVGIGTLSSLVSVGGGTMTVPFLVWCNVNVRKAIGTSAAVGMVIGLGGTMGYIFNGELVNELPEGSLGFVYLPALVWTMLASVIMAPVGARALGVLSPRAAKRVFALLLAGMATHLFIKYG